MKSTIIKFLTLTKSKAILILLTVLSFSIQAQNELDGVSTEVTGRAPTVFIALSAIILLYGLWHLVNGFMKAMGEEQGGWKRVGIVVLVWVIWFGAVPAIYNAFKDRGISSGSQIGR